jgi:hypothetical protein
VTSEQILHSASAVADSDRVREHTSVEINRELDSQARQCVQAFACQAPEEITAHIDQLSREWDVERYLETNAGILSLSGVALGALVSRKFLLLPGIVFGFLLQHAIQGWCPPVPIFRRFGVRTRKEINREKYALKALRGDFDAVPTCLDNAASDELPVDPSTL